MIQDHWSEECSFQFECQTLGAFAIFAVLPFLKINCLLASHIVDLSLSFGIVRAAMTLHPYNKKKEQNYKKNKEKTRVYRMGQYN
jgi:hypothetical protein